MKYSVVQQHISAVRVDGAVTCSGLRFEILTKFSKIRNILFVMYFANSLPIFTVTSTLSRSSCGVSVKGLRHYSLLGRKFYLL